MKKKITIIGVLITLLLIGTQVFGATEYNRKPVGDTITSPVTFTFHFNNWYDIGLATSTPTHYSFVFGNSCNAVYAWTGTYLPVSQKNLDTNTYQQTYDISGNCEISDVYLYFADAPENATWISDYQIGYYTLPESGFTIKTGFIALTTDFVSSTLAYIGQAVTGLGPILYIIIGLPLAFWVIWKIFGLVPKDKIKRK